MDKKCSEKQTEKNDIINIKIPLGKGPNGCAFSFALGGGCVFCVWGLTLLGLLFPEIYKYNNNYSSNWSKRKVNRNTWFLTFSYSQ